MFLLSLIIQSYVLYYFYIILFYLAILLFFYIFLVFPSNLAKYHLRLLVYLTFCFNLLLLVILISYIGKQYL